MKKKIIDIVNMIKSNKRYKYTLIVTVMLLFVSVIGYSLSFFNKDSSVLTANIRVNGFAYNITTNGGTSDDRILRLQAGKTETFSAIITNLNNLDTKYELIYEICTDVNCTNKLNELPEGIVVGLNPSLTSDVNGTLSSSATTTVNILTENNTSQDYYIKLNLNAGYVWNDLALVNMFEPFSKITSIIAYVDGVEVSNYPNDCNYATTIKGYKNGSEVTLKNKSVTCDKKTNEWRISYVGFADKIKIYFIENPTVSDYIVGLDLTSNGLEVDDTVDKNLRYVGATPKNYIEFNGETWRIIGVFNNITTIDEEGNENVESLVKIIRNEPLGSYSWDTSESSINDGYGINEWSQADLMSELNIDYLDTSKTSDTTTWYNGRNNLKTATYDYSKNIKSTSIDKIANVRWNTIGVPFDSSVTNLSVLNTYNYERNTTSISTPSDGVTRKTTWDGKVALMYLSDYGFASTNTSCRSNIILSIDFTSDMQIGEGICRDNNWLFNTVNQWVLSPRMNSANYTFGAYSYGFGMYSEASGYGTVRPAIYLKSDVKISGGVGTEGDPYTILGESIFNKFRADSWETIANNVRNGNTSLYNVGDTKTVTINGINYNVRVANNSTPSECSGANFSQTACGFVVEFTDIVDNRMLIAYTSPLNGNVGGWPATFMRRYLNGTFYNNLPEELRNVIITTTVISGHGSTSGEENFSSTDKIYLLSGHEVYEDGTNRPISTYETAYNNTRQLDYYQSKGVTTDNFLSAVKKYNGDAYYWWLRTSYSNNTDTFLIVRSNGSYNHGVPGYFIGVSPAFRIG